MTARRDTPRVGRFSASERIYAALLWLYPPSLRRAYGGDMRQVFRDNLRDEARCRRARGVWRAWTRTLGDLGASLPREWPREFTRGGPEAARFRAALNSPVIAMVSPRRRHRGPFDRRDGWARRFARRANMQEKFDKFTERARHVLALSQEEAQRFNHNYIGTEHLLLGLVREVEGIGARALVAMDVSLERVHSDVEFIIGRGDRLVLGEVGLTPRAKKIVELAVDEARRMNHHYIGTEHLLLGMVREGEGIAAGVLESLGVTLERARAHVLTLVGGPGGAEAREGGRRGKVGPDLRPMSVMTLTCRDVDMTLAFYVNILGAAQSAQTNPMARAFGDGVRLARLPGDGPASGGPLLALRPGAVSSAAGSAEEPGAILLSFVTGDIDAAHTTVRARGATTLSEVSDVPGAPGQREFTLTDPDGRALRFFGPARA